MLITAIEIRFLHYISCTVWTLFERCFLFSKAQIWKLTMLVKEKVGQDIWRAYFAAERSELFYHGYAVLDGIVEASANPAILLNALRHLASTSPKPLKTLFDLLMSTHPGERNLKEAKSLKLCNSIVNHCWESLHEANGSRVTGSYFFMDKFLSNYSICRMTTDGCRVQSKMYGCKFCLDGSVQCWTYT